MDTQGAVACFFIEREEAARNFECVRGRDTAVFRRCGDKIKYVRRGLESGALNRHQ
jgi:hypothetical protein